MPLGRLPSLGDVRHEALLGNERGEGGDRGRLVIIGADVHDLRARALGEANEAQVTGRERPGERGPLRGNHLADPRERVRRHEVGLADERDPREGTLITDRRPVEGALAAPPQPLKRRHHVVEVALGLPAPLLGHLHGIGERIEQLQRMPVRTTLLVWVTRSRDGGEGHRRNVHERGACLGLVQVTELPLEVVRHPGLRLLVLW